MHASSFDFRQCHDASRQLAFKSALVIHLFLEICESEICPVKYLETNAAAFGQPLTRQLDPDFRKLVGSNLYSSPVRCKLIGNFQFLELDHDTLGFLRIHIGVQRLIFDAIDEIDQDPEQNQDKRGGTRQCQLLLKRVTREERFNLVKSIWSWSGH